MTTAKSIEQQATKSNVISLCEMNGGKITCDQGPDVPIMGYAVYHADFKDGSSMSFDKTIDGEVTNFYAEGE